MFQVEFYETQDGKKPVADFLDSLDDKMAAKLISLMELLEAKGSELRMPKKDVPTGSAAMARKSRKRERRV